MESIFKGQEFKRLREERKVSCEELSSLTKKIDGKGIGVDRSTIFRIENGSRKNPSLETVCLMLKALGFVNVNKFINWAALGSATSPPELDDDLPGIDAIDQDVYPGCRLTQDCPH